MTTESGERPERNKGPDAPAAPASSGTRKSMFRMTLAGLAASLSIGPAAKTEAGDRRPGRLRPVRMMGVESIAYFLVTFGTLALLAVILQHLRSVGEYAALGMRRRISIALIVGLVLVVMGGGALTALVMKL